MKMNFHYEIMTYSPINKSHETNSNLKINLRERSSFMKMCALNISTLISKNNDCK